MRLKRFRVTNFRSVEDSGTTTIGQMACLVGKNEAGKTAILLALAGLNPHPATPVTFDKERDYPRRFFTEYGTRHSGGEATVIETGWELDADERQVIVEKLGPDSLKDDLVVVSRRYEDDEPQWEWPLDHAAVVTYLKQQHALDAKEARAVVSATTTSELRQALEGLAQPSPRQSSLLETIRALPKQSATGVIEVLLVPKLPQLMYFSHYDRMAGEIRVDDIIDQRDVLGRERIVPNFNPIGQVVNNTVRHVPLEMPERVFVDFLSYAGTSLDEIRGSSTYESLTARCEAASNAITDQLNEYWSQNPFLEVEIRITKAEPDDPVPLNEGTVARARVRNTLHRATVNFSERSAGFVWFFSFLVKFAQVRKKATNLLILLDEPGLTLHGKAQDDLLRFFEDRIIPSHQLVFSTHSPFMVPVDDLTLSHIVEDDIVEGRGGRRTTNGTKLREDVLAVDPDTLFPLQGALGYDVTQTLFIGKNTLLVEGPGDILFLHALSTQLAKRGKAPLDRRWSLCPSGGIDKIQSFVSLFAGAKLDIAVLTDFATSDRRKLDQIKKNAILSEGRILNYAEVLGLAEGDVEDVFDEETYLDLVNQTLCLSDATKLTPAKVEAAAPSTIRLVKRVEAACKLLPPETTEFDHFAPADFLIRHPQLLDVDTPAVARTLENAEKVVAAVNRLLTRI